MEVLQNTGWKTAYGEEVIVPPLHAIFNICRRGGHYAIKRPSYHIIPLYTPRTRDRRGTFERVRSEVLDTAHVAASVPGNLENSEYRFWIGMNEPLAKWCACRMCGHPAMDKTGRQRHFDLSLCSTNILRVYKMIHMDKPRRCAKCADVCEKPTAMWGVPLHKHCIEAWKFDRIAMNWSHFKAKADQLGLLQTFSDGKFTHESEVNEG